MTEALSDGTLRFELLGTLRVTRGQVPLDLGPAKQRAVLATLLISANRAVPSSRIVAAVWGEEPPANGTNVVQKYVAGLRRVLEPDREPRSTGELLTLEDGGYRLAVPAGGSDVDSFEAQVRSARRLRQDGRLEEASRHLQHALTLWRSEPLEGLTGPAFEAERRRLLEHRAGTVEEYAEIELELGHHERLAAELPTQVQAFPLRERLRGVQMLALHRSGRTDEALAAYRDLHDHLVDEYGVEPGLELQQLHTRIQGDPAAHEPVRAGRGDGRDWWLGRGWPADMSDLVPPQRPRTGRVLLKAAAVLGTVGTVGFGGSVAMAALAVRRQRKVLGLLAAVYLAVWIAGLVLISAEEEGASTAVGDLGFGLMLLVLLVSAIHLAIVVAPVSVRRIRALAALEERRRARELVARDPAAGRRLGIGRPDLPRDYDDGGMIDPNEVPAGVLTRIPGVTAQHAALIVVDREHRGRFATLADLSRRGLFPTPLPPVVESLLIVVPLPRPSDFVGGAGQTS